MKAKLVTMVVLPYSKAYILKMRLEAKKIKCELEDVHLIEGSNTTTVRVKILEDDIQAAMPELDILLGLKPESKKEKPTKRQILVPIDFTNVSSKSARLATSLAIHLNAQLVFFHSYISPINYPVPIGDFYPIDSSSLLQSKEVEEAANKNFGNFISELAQHVGTEKWETLNSEYIIKPGYASEDILAYAREHQPRLIVIGRGGDKLPGTVGSVTADVMYNATTPVLVVPEEMEERLITDFKEIMYATNFDAKDFAALDKLMDILKPFDIKITCAHVGQPDEHGWDLARLEGMKDILHKKYETKNFECKLIIGRDVLHTLDYHLKHENIDILSLTTHKRNMLSRLFNPSLARKMVFHSHVPLLVFHA